MNILMVAAENGALPKGKVGGIGDVIRDVPLALTQQGHQVSVVTPGYQFHSLAPQAEKHCEFPVVFAGKTEIVSLFRLHPTPTSDVQHWVLEHPLMALGGAGKIYCDDGATRPFASDATKFAFFCQAVATLLGQHWHQQFDVLHLHDWHAAFLAILRQFDSKAAHLKPLRTVYTIHNLALQGIRPFRGDSSSFYTWFPHLAVDEQMLADPRYQNCINPTRAAINFSDKIHVVSPTYATEIVKSSSLEHGFVGGEGLEHDLELAQQQGRLFGILNGCDYDVSLPQRGTLTQLCQLTQAAIMQWISETVTVKSSHFIAAQRLQYWLSSYTACKGPIVTSIGRLTDQKVALLLAKYQGKLVLDVLAEKLAEQNGLMVILGSGDAQLEQQITQVMARHHNVLFLNGFGENLSDHIYVSGDLFLMPSLFEPCGISQLLAMRAGQPCLVHKIGGLADTVKHLETGFCFEGETPAEQISQLISTFETAITLFSTQPKTWQKLSKKAKQQRFTWQQSVEQYVKYLY